MTTTTLDRLEKMGIDLPEPGTAAAKYVPWVQTGNLIFTSGQLPLKNGTLTATGLLGRDLDTTEGREVARWCAINVLAQLRDALGDLDRVKRLVKITVFVAGADGFTDHHLVANGASELLAEAFAERGQHARSAVGMAALPLNAPVEVEAIVEID
ncbi:RidA family protein [Paenarthrobacter sp. NPDC090520]|uniref:RidA family protein n=1 Tax=unclassified Paenarthrobacter TaxID=2634190 RepID=UPI003830FBFB